MKKHLILFSILILTCLSFVGCAQKEDTDNSEPVNFDQEITQTPYNFDIMGYSGDIQFNGDGQGTLTLSDGASKTFSYTVSNISDNGKKADITVQNTGISEVDNQTISAEIVSDGLKVSYSGFSFVLKPAD